MFNVPYKCEYSSSGSQRASNLLQKKDFQGAGDSARKRLWDRKNVKDQELTKFDVMTAQFKALENEVCDGRRDLADLEKLKIALKKV